MCIRDRCLTDYADADFVSCVATRRSTFGGAALWGARVVMRWPTTQKTMAFSSGEAEPAGIVR
eukprot:12224431-Alexandrium_andersonii.AAC.1